MRPRLLRALLCRWDVPVVCLEAGAGFGKSTILAQAYQENLLAPRGADAWLTCELADASASALLAGIVTTLGGPVESDVDVTAAAEAIWSASPVEVAVLLDDVHLIEPGSPGEAALAGLVEALPANGHLVIAGRRLPDLPLAAGCATTSREDHRRRSALHRGGAPRVRGERSGRRGSPGAGRGLAGTHRVRGERPERRLAAFVLEEVVAALDPAVRRTLAIAALIGGGDAALLSAAARDEVDLDAFREIPLVACTPEGNVHVHAMWSDLLVSELDDAERIEACRVPRPSCSQRAVRTVRRSSCSRRRGSGSKRGSALLEACTDQVQPAPPEQLRRWRRMAPEAEIGAGPAAYIDALVARADAPWSAEARDHFACAIVEFAAADDIHNELRVRVRAGYSAWQREDLEMFADALQRYDELRDRIPGLPLVSTLVRAVCADIEGDHDRVLEELRTVDSADFEPRLAYFPPLMRADARLGTGQVGATLEEACAAAELAAGVVPAAGAHSACLRPALARWCSDDPAALHEAVLASDPGTAVARDERAETLGWGAIAAAHAGDVPRMRELLRELEAIIEPFEAPARPARAGGAGTSDRRGRDGRRVRSARSPARRARSRARETGDELARGPVAAGDRGGARR